MENRDPADERILVVSARLPFDLREGPSGLESRPATGGLLSTLQPVMRKIGGTWLGGCGPEVGAERTLSVPGEAYRVVALPLSEEQVQKVHHGFSSHTLWPLLHSFPERARFDLDEWEAYRDVNLRFARTAVAESGEAGTVWLHDHQLLLAPLFLRILAPRLEVLSFLHLPFPPYDVFRLLPWRREVLEGMLAADFVGFHIRDYVDNFLHCAERLLGARVDREQGFLSLGQRQVRVGAAPIGIDFDRFASLAREAAEPPGLPPRFVLGADRLDHTKGIPERIRVFERLLERHPEHREEVTLLQIAVPSPCPTVEQQALKRELDELVGRVNGRFASATWSPIRYLHHAFSQEELAALYRRADVGLVTPLRDGMNVVAKEFVACQVDEPGVLVLSELAGAAETMQEALIVNPHDVEGSADSLHRALRMERPERARRMEALRHRERGRDVHRWLANFLEAARQDRA
ncbi:MAG: trehalose-6-phosphate synthase [Myxococcota bacterium]|nr:trehalose-6-phosphate synthase [Myxococcota bacterium]